MSRSEQLSRMESDRPPLGALGMPPMEASTPRRGQGPFWIITACSFICFGLAFAIITPPAIKAAKNHAAHAASRGDQLLDQNPRQAIAYFQVAKFLDPAKLEYGQKLSDAYLAQGVVSRALETLKHSGGREEQIASLLLRLDRPDEAVSTLEAKSQKAPSGETYLLLAKALTEIQAYDRAQRAAEQAAQYPSTKENAIVFEVITAKLQGQTDIVYTSVGSQEATRRIAGAKAGETALAQVLYDLGLLRSSQRVLESVATPNVASYRLLAQVKLAQQPTSQQNLLDAANFLRKAIEINPQDISIRRQLRDVYTQLGSREGVDRESKLIKLLEAGEI